MNPKFFHTPASARARCPVCHQPVYSRAGIHPQCAVRQSDPPIPKVKPPVVSADVAAVVAVVPEIAVEDLPPPVIPPRKPSRRP